MIQDRRKNPAGIGVSVTLHPISACVGAVTKQPNGSGCKNFAFRSAQKEKPIEMSSHWSKTLGVATIVVHYYSTFW